MGTFAAQCIDQTFLGRKKKPDRIGYLFIYLSIFVVVVEAEMLQCQCEGQWLVFASAGEKWEKKKEARRSGQMSRRVCAVSICRGLMADMLTWRATPWWWTATPRGKYHPPTMTDRWCEWCCCSAEWIVPTTQGLWLEAVKATWGARQWHHSEPQEWGASRTECVYLVAGKARAERERRL